MGRISLRLLRYKKVNHYLQKLEVRANRIEQTNARIQDDILWALEITGEILNGENACLPLALAGQIQLNLHHSTSLT